METADSYTKKGSQVQVASLIYTRLSGNSRYCHCRGEVVSPCVAVSCCIRICFLVADTQVSCTCDHNVCLNW